MSILPADIYVVVNKSIITDQDKKILNMLYLPIIGSLPIMLYNTLLNDLEYQDLISSDLTHAHLLSNLHISNSLQTYRLRLSRNLLTWPLWYNPEPMLFLLL